MNKSKAAIILVSLISLALVLPGCSRAGSSINGSGRIISNDIEVTDFTRITAQGAFILEISQADDFRITISTDDNLISRIRFLHEEETLKMAIQAPANFFPTLLKVEIHMPRIYGLDMSDGARATLSGFKSTFNFDLEVSGGSTVSGTLDAGNSVFDVSSASQVNLKGSALSLALEASGTSKLDLADFVVNTAQIYLKEKSEADLHINGRVDVKLEDASRIYYLGNPTFSNTSISGGSYMQHK